MKEIIEISEKLNKYFNETANKIGGEVKFIKRQRKITATSFVKTMILGAIEGGDNSIESICQMLYEEKIRITKQGLECRFTKEAVALMEGMFEEGLNVFRSKLRIECKMLEYFKTVKILDSSYISLPNCMEGLYKGYCARYPGQESKTKAAVKIQLMYDYLNQNIARVDIKDGIRSDQGYKDYLSNIERKDLFIADLGYFVPSSFDIISKKGAYFLMRYKADTNLYNGSERIEILEHLKNKEKIEKELFLGKEAKVKVRLIGSKLPKKLSEARRRKANKLAKSQGYKSSKRNQKLLDWSIFITNIPFDVLKAEELLQVYKLRWQIELLFKLYKSNVGIDNLKSKVNSAKILCKLYAKLSAIAIFHGLANCVKLEKNTEFSMTKAMLSLKNHARELCNILRQDCEKIAEFFATMIKSWRIFAIKDRYRKKRISTLQSLTLPSLHPLT